jgi:hypothetical protein
MAAGQVLLISNLVLVAPPVPLVLVLHLKATAGPVMVLPVHSTPTPTVLPAVVHMVVAAAAVATVAVQPVVQEMDDGKMVNMSLVQPTQN